MLDEDEYAQIRLLYMESIRATKEFRERHRVPLKVVLRPERFRPVLAMSTSVLPG